MASPGRGSGSGGSRARSRYAARAVRRTAWPCSQWRTISLASGALAAPRPAQLADDPVLAPGVEVDQLAGQRGAPAVDAAVPVGLEGAETATQQDALELLHVSAAWP